MSVASLRAQVAKLRAEVPADDPLRTLLDAVGAIPRRGPPCLGSHPQPVAVDLCPQWEREFMAELQAHRGRVPHYPHRA